MKVKELISKLNCSSTLPIRMKRDIYDPGTILCWKYQNVIYGGNCTVSSVTITNEEMIIYYQPPKNNR